MPDEGHYDAGDQSAVDNAGKEAARRDAEDKETFRVWMSHPKGRDLLYRIVYDVCHLGGDTLMALDDHGRSDPLRTYLSLGERNVGAWLDDKMRAHPELYMKALQEQQVEREARNQRLLKQNERKDGGEEPYEASAFA